jgi:hypothetical protein
MRWLLVDPNAISQILVLVSFEHHPSRHRPESPNGKCFLSVRRECTFPAVLLDRGRVEQRMPDLVSRRSRLAIRRV